METQEAIRARRDVRQFTDEPIPDADFGRILAAGRLAPSAKNWQPWGFGIKGCRSGRASGGESVPGPQQSAAEAAGQAVDRVLEEAPARRAPAAQ